MNEKVIESFLLRNSKYSSAWIKSATKILTSSDIFIEEELAKFDAEQLGIIVAALEFNEKNKDNHFICMNNSLKKTFYKRNTTNFIETSKSFKKNEIIQEEDSNKYLSSQSNLSNEDILKKDEKRKISDFEKNNNNINNKNNKTENKEKEIIKRNSFYKDKKSNFNTNSNEEEKIIEFSENSSSYKKIDNSIEASQRNNNITKKILNTNERKKADSRK